jgi:hypothetical protein
MHTPRALTAAPAVGSYSLPLSAALRSPFSGFSAVPLAPSGTRFGVCRRILVFVIGLLFRFADVAMLAPRAPFVNAFFG